MSLTATHSLDFCGVISDSKRIVRAHSPHFLALSAVFFLPLSFPLIIFPTLLTILAKPTAQSLTLYLLNVLFVLVLSLSGVATITYSTFHGFYSRPVKFAAAMKSIFYSFLPLLATVLIVLFIVASVGMASPLFVGLFHRTIEAIIGYPIEYNSSWLTGIVLVLLLIWLQMNWTLASVIVVAESKWGLESLRRSAYLMKGMRSLPLLLTLFYGFTSGFWLTLQVIWGGIADWGTWAFILQTVGCSCSLVAFMIQSTVANSVLYMYCMALHGELSFEELAQEYMSLPIDDSQ